MVLNFSGVAGFDLVATIDAGYACISGVHFLAQHSLVRRRLHFLFLLLVSHFSRIAWNNNG